MFLHDEGVASSRNIVQMQTAKMQKHKTILHSIDLQHGITFLSLQNLCISLQKRQKRVFLRGSFCIEMPLRTHKTHRSLMGFVLFHHLAVCHLERNSC